MHRISSIFFFPLILALDLHHVTIELKENTPIEELRWNLNDYQENRSEYSLSYPSEYFEIISPYLFYRGEQFDREELCSTDVCQLELQIFSQYSSILLFQLIILDVNDCQPRFEDQSMEFILRENLPKDYRVQLPMANDRDSMEFNIDRYEFVNASIEIERMFRLEKSSGEFRLNILEPFDCERHRNYHLFIIAIDKGGWKSNILHVHIIVGDVNEYQPRFLQRFYHTRIAENVLIGNGSSDSILQIRAIDDDCDDQMIEYSIINNEIPWENFPFFIDKSTGLIRVKQILDYERISIYRFRVRASNLDQITSSLVPVMIDIFDINDNPPLIHVNILNEYLNETIIQIKENLSPGQVIGNVLIRDMDSMLTNHQLEVRIQSCLPTCPIELDMDVFSSTTSLIRIAKQLDRESFDRRFKIVLQARDYGQPSLKSEYQMQMEVIDVNDCAPRFTQENYRFRVSNETAMGSSFGQIQAMDEDDSPEYRQIRYQFLDEHKQEEIISIDPINGTVYLIRYPLVDTQWNRTILAIDQENPLLFDQTTIEIFFSYQKTCVWGFSEDIYTFNTTEHQTIPYEIGRIDFQYCSQSISYDDSASLPFSFDIITGKITVIEELDREIRDIYEFILRIFVNDTHQSFQTKISIEIVDINDHFPRFTTSLHQYLSISIIHSPIFITTIHAIDPDLDRNGLIDYYFLNRDFYAYFHLFTNGSIVLYNSIHIQLPIHLEIYARDRGYPKALNSTERMNIYLCDVSQPQQCFGNSFQRRFWIVLVFLMVVVIGFSSMCILGMFCKLIIREEWKRKVMRL